MDVVRNNIDQIGGTIDVKSVAGAGLSFTIKILSHLQLSRRSLLKLPATVSRSRSYRS
jgi:hypothetical protein